MDQVIILILWQREEAGHRSSRATPSTSERHGRESERWILKAALQLVIGRTAIETWH